MAQKSEKIAYEPATNYSVLPTTGSLLSNTNRIEAPFVRVKLGNNTFGVYEPTGSKGYKANYIKKGDNKYPNYIQSLEIDKINGTVNEYTLNISYPVTQDNDPNFFDKLFSTVSSSRIISIDYGDFMQPNYIYRDEEAIITAVTESLDTSSSVISYTVKATSTAALTLSGSYNFGGKTVKPSDEIFRILYNCNNEYHLLDVFTGMEDRGRVELNHLIAGDDEKVYIPYVTGKSALEYIALLVSYMKSVNEADTAVYSLTTFEDTTGTYGGPYFKVTKIEKRSNAINQLCTYNVDIGYPTSNVVTNFTLKSTDNWSIYYDYNKEASNSEYIAKVDDKGKTIYEYSPMLTGTKYYSDAKDLQWWNSMTSFPIQAELTLKGLLKPSILMQYVKINVWFYGRKHISSGYYIITSQKDKIDFNGYTTTLGLTRLAADEGWENEDIIER